MSRDLNIELMILRFSESFQSTSVIESTTRRLDKIWEGAIWTVNWRKISLLISDVIAIFLKIEWASARLKEWLWFEFSIFNNQRASSPSCSRFAINEKEQATHLLLVWRRSWPWGSRTFLSRSQINHAFLRISSLNFLVRRRTTAYPSDPECSFTRRMRLSSDSKVCRSSENARGMMTIMQKRWRCEKFDDAKTLKCDEKKIFFSRLPRSG